MRKLLHCIASNPLIPETLRQGCPPSIFHDQSVREVMGIYAELVVVEKKCVDMDELHLAAAQEVDLYKRGHVGTGQWQTLIALHQLVHTLSRIHNLTTYRVAFINHLSSSYSINTMTSFWHLSVPRQAKC